MIEVGSDMEILAVPFDVRCTFLHILYSQHPCHTADAAASLCHTTGPKTGKGSPVNRGSYNKGSW